VHAVSGDREQEIHARVLEQAKHLGAHGQLRAMLARQGKGGKAEGEKAKEEKDRKVA
jgi:hypothetical protein